MKTIGVLVKSEFLEDSVYLLFETTQKELNILNDKIKIINKMHLEYVAEYEPLKVEKVNNKLNLSLEQYKTLFSSYPFNCIGESRNIFLTEKEIKNIIKAMDKVIFNQEKEHNIDTVIEDFLYELC